MQMNVHREINQDVAHTVQIWIQDKPLSTSQVFLN